MICTETLLNPKFRACFMKAVAESNLLNAVVSNVFEIAKMFE